MARTEWLSEGAEKLAFEKPQDGFHCDIAIVGSGYGGAVAAARLAGATESDGRRSRVWVLERGREHVPGGFPERFADLPGHVRINAGEDPAVLGLPEGLFDLRLGRHVNALLGNGLGGGSLINAGVLARPLPQVFQPSPWPSTITSSALDKYFGRVEEMLDQVQLPAPAPAKLEALQALGRRFGGAGAQRANIALTIEPGENDIGVQQNRCIRCGDCFTGCNFWAKNTLAMNYLPLAWRREARLFTGVTVLSLAAQNGMWSLEIQLTDPQIARRFGPLPRLIVRRVILAAGAYGSTAILMRSRERGFNALSAQRLGERFSTNGDMIAVGYRLPIEVNASGHEAQAPAARGVGPTICGMIDLRQQEGLAIEEMAIPAALRRAFEEVVTTVGAIGDLAKIDWSWHRFRASQPDPAAINAEHLAKTAVYATMGDDGAGGRILPLAGPEALTSDGAVRIEWEHIAAEPVFRRAIAILERGHKGWGKATAIPNPMWRALPSSIGAALDGGELGGTVFTVHPLGGCGMAERAEKGVVNHLGQVFAGSQGTAVHDTLVVLDGSIVPTALGINPCLTIAALAEYAVEGLAHEDVWGLKLMPALECLRKPPPRPAPVPRDPEQGLPVAPTAVRLAERLRGNLELPVPMAGGGRQWSRFRAELDIEYTPIENLEHFLARLPKVLDIPAARLRLEGTLPAGAAAGSGMQWSETIELAGRLHLFGRKSSWVFGRIARAGLAWFRNRGSEIPRMFCRRAPARRGGKGLVRGWLAIASRAGEVRTMAYELDVLASRLLVPGERLTGTKRIAYQNLRSKPWPTPWEQLTQLPVVIGTGMDWRDAGTLEVDLPYFVQQFAAQLQVTRQQDQPRAIADLFSLGAYLARLMGGIHFWSFRAPDYPNPYPLYEFPHEFNREEREAAEKAARDADFRIDNRLAHRLPGEIPGHRRTVFDLELPQPEDEPPPADDPQQALAPQIRLTRYESETRPHDAARAPVLLIHGLGASGNTFTLPTIGCNLVQHLTGLGFDPWVLDLRTSIGLPSSKRDWSFDHAAHDDIVAAIDRVLAETGHRQVDVVAHCIGAAMFSMAALSGRLRNPAYDTRTARKRTTAPGRWFRYPSRVRAAVLSQVGPLLELPATNRFRGYIASYFKYYLRIGEFDTAASLAGFNRFVDRVLATYPYPRHEREVHHLRWLAPPITHEAFCLRAFGIYGRLFEHDNLNPATLDRLGDYLGHVRYRTYQQTIFYATMRRLTDQLGRNLFVTNQNIEDHFHFPVCFVHGDENEVFDRQTSRRSFDLLASVFWPQDLADVWARQPEARDRYSGYERGRQLRIHQIAGYGHQDSLIGHRAAADVFPRISEFLLEAAPHRRISPRQFVVRPPRMGPIVGWLRAGPGGGVTARLLFTPNDSRSRPLYAMTVAMRAGRPLPGRARFHSLLEGPQPGPATEIVEVDLPADGGCEVVVLTVHAERYEAEPERDAGEPRGDDPFGENRDRFPDLPSGLHFPNTGTEAAALEPGAVQPFVEPVLATTRDLDLDRAPIGTQPRTCDQRYALPVSVAVLSAEVIAAPLQKQGDGVCFALASCRFGATVFDRELADAALGRLHTRLNAQGEAGRPQALFLAGDAIYADATYGLFDPTLGTERYDQRYVEAWTAPHAREVLRRVPVYPMLDDHEVEENFEGRPEQPSPEMVAGLRAFEQFQLRLTPAFRDPQELTPYIDRYWYMVCVGGFEFFVADTRTQRRRMPGPASVHAAIMRRTQMHALCTWLSGRAPETPKFVVSPSVVAPWMRETAGSLAYSLRSDAWDGYPESLHELLGFIAEHELRNVVFLSGDYHASLFCEITLAHADKSPVRAYSIVSSGLYSPYPFANTRTEDLALRFEGTHQDWLGSGVAPCCQGRGALHIEYRAAPIADAAFAIVGVAQRASGSYMTVEFDGTAPIEVPLA